MAEPWKATILDVVDGFRHDWPSSALAVGGAWASPKVLQDVEQLRPLFEWIELQLGAPILGDRFVAWALILERGDQVAAHRHVKAGDRLPDNRHAGVYYVALPPASGRLVIHSVLGPAGPPPCHLFVEDMHEGESITFPASARHLVTEHRSDRPRISISWSAR